MPLLRSALWITAIAYAINFLVLGFLVGPFDYDHLGSYYEIAWRFWMTGQGTPQFNPFLQGGRTLGGDPQIPLFNPFFLLVPVLGAVWTIKIELLMQLALGLWGLRAIARIFSFSSEKELWLIFLFACSGGVVSRFLVGHVTLGFFLCLPALLALSYRKNFFLYTLLLIYCALHKPNFFLQLAILLGFETVFRSFTERSLKPLGFFAAALFFAVGITAVTYLPAMKYFRDFPRPDNGAIQWTPPYTLFFNLFLPLKTLPKIFYGERFIPRHEYNQALSPWALALAALSLWNWKRLPPKLKALSLTALMAAVLGCGAPSQGLSLWPFSWFRAFFPGFSSIRVAPRFWFFTGFSLMMLSTFSFKLPAKKKETALFILLGILPLLVPMIINLSKTTFQARETQWASRSQITAEPAWVKNSIDRTLPPIREGNGALLSIDNLSFPISDLLREGPHLSTTSSIPLDVSTKWLGWSSFEVKARAPATASDHPPFSLSFNLNSHPYWQVTSKAKEKVKIISSRTDLLTLQADSGEIDATLHFRQPWVREGLLISLTSLFVFLVFAFLAIRRSSR
jgi:hypothetical protein